ncbi:unnamed protein product [Pedinophyceae sp. YPF-701]|nr:unnamed protein product [Pedinophyceae sp. YPF-701]
MTEYDNTQLLQGLMDLIKTDPQEEVPEQLSRPNPGAIGPGGLLPGVKVAKPKEDPKAIWDPEEVPEVLEDDIDDGREQPEYDIIYRQAVGTEDAYLGMSGKTPSSTNCEQLSVEVRMPLATGIGEIDLDVQETYLRVASPAYKLGVYLPHRVNSDKGTAKWDAGKKVLLVHLPIRRDEFGMALS